jgi:hypothetical protein
VTTFGVIPPPQERPPHREVGSVWTTWGQRLKVEHNRGTVIVAGVTLTTAAERDDFARVYFQACAEADDWAREHETCPCGKPMTHTEFCYGEGPPVPP